MAEALSPQTELEIEQLLQRYPTRSAALVPVLHAVQRELGHLTPQTLLQVAKRLNLPPAQVYSVSTFYTLFNRRPVGKYHVQVCVSISCALVGSHRLISMLEEKLETRLGETSEDGLFTLSEVECLASCGSGPMMQVNDKYYENLHTSEALDKVLAPMLAERSAMASKG